MAEIVPFPTARRTDFVGSVAEIVGALSPAAGERYLTRVLDAEHERMETVGIGCQYIADDLTDFASAIRTKISREAVGRPGGGGCA